MNLLKHILVVDDSPRDIELTVNALETYQLTNKITALHDGAEALDYLYRRGEFAGCTDAQPAVILLDLKMPRVDGIEVLRQIKGDPVLKMIPVVVMTSSREEQDVLNSYQLGVNAYVVKPVKFQEFVEAVKHLGMFWAILNEPPPDSPPRLDGPAN
jgi:two-component system response regulator